MFVSLGNSWLQAIDEAKQKHILALILAKVLLEKYDWSYSITDHIVPNPLIQASKHKIDELVVEILQKYPELVNDRDNDRMTALDMLSTKRLSFRSGSNYLFSEIGKTPSVPVQMIETIIYSCKLY